METVYYTLTGIILYLLADWLLQQLELRAGRRFTNRSILFFFILMGLALVAFGLLRRLLVPAAP